jgi:hypothetical protein
MNEDKINEKENSSNIKNEQDFKIIEKLDKVEA